MLYSKSKEISNIRKLKNEGKIKEALNIINELEDEKDLSLQDKFEINYLKSSLLLEIGYLDEALKYNDLAYKESQQIRNKFQTIDTLVIKKNILARSDKDALETIMEAEQILNSINQTSSLEFKEKKALIELQKGAYYGGYKGDINRSLMHLNNCLTIAKEIKNERLIMLSTKRSSFNYIYKGNPNRALEYLKQYKALAIKLNDKQEIIGALNAMGVYYTDKGDFERALVYLERGLSLCDEINSWKTAVLLSSLFELYIHANSLEKAQECLDRQKQFRDKESVKTPDIFYRLSKALLLKRKPQKINHLKAKEILKQIVDVEKSFAEALCIALIELCDLYIKELRETSNLKVLDEIQPYIIQLMDSATHSFWLQIEVYSLRAKLKLITFEFQEAQDLLSKALDIAEKYGQKRLAIRIMNEQSEFSNNFMKWEKLKASRAKISERMDLARIDEQIEILLQKRRYLQRIKN